MGEKLTFRTNKVGPYALDLSRLQSRTVAGLFKFLILKNSNFN